MIDTNIWLDIPGYEGKYQILISGKKVKSLSRVAWNGKGCHILQERILNGYTRKDNYISFGLVKNGKSRTELLHQIVMLIKEGPCPEGMEVCHNDGNPANNHPDNLRYDTHSENNKDRHRHGYKGSCFGKKGKESFCSKPVVQYSKDGILIKQFESMTDAAINTGAKLSAISQNISGKYKTAGGYIWKFL